MTAVTHGSPGVRPIVGPPTVPMFTAVNRARNAGNSPTPPDRRGPTARFTNTYPFELVGAWLTEMSGPGSPRYTVRSAPVRA